MVASRKAGTSRNLLFAGAASLVIFVVIFAIVYFGVFEGADSAAAIALNHAYVGPSFNEIMVLATNYGREYFWTAVVAFMLIFGRRETKILAIELAVLFVVGVVVGEALKLAYFRERPFIAMPSAIDLRTVTDADSSFPSGHAIIVGIGAMFFFGARARNKAAAVLLAIESAVVCYSRVYLGAHFPTDVLGGLAVAGVIAFLGLYVIGHSFVKRYFDAIGGFFEKLFRAMRIPAVI